MSSKASVQVGPGLVTGLTLLFAAGKIFGYLDWSWWWVFSPVWISLSFVGLIVGVALLVAFIGAVIYR